MDSDFEPPVCSIEWLRVDQVDELYTTLEPNFKNNGWLLRERTLEEILRDIQEYFVVRVQDTIVGVFQLKESQNEERFLELGAFVVCTTQKEERRRVKDDIVQFSLEQSKERCLDLISLTTHPSLSHLYEKNGAKKLSSGTFPSRERISPDVTMYSFS